jgi:preprotein translocase subunit SecG
VWTWLVNGDGGVLLVPILISILLLQKEIHRGAGLGLNGDSKSTFETQVLGNSR